VCLCACKFVAITENLYFMAGVNKVKDFLAFILISDRCNNNNNNQLNAICFSYFLKVQELPDHNFETLKLLVNHLKLVSDNCDKNKVLLTSLHFRNGLCNTQSFRTYEVFTCQITFNTQFILDSFATISKPLWFVERLLPKSVLYGHFFVCFSFISEGSYV